VQVVERGPTPEVQIVTLAGESIESLDALGEVRGGNADLGRQRLERVGLVQPPVAGGSRSGTLRSGCNMPGFTGPIGNFLRYLASKIIQAGTALPFLACASYIVLPTLL
jgi:hypothetical protein